MRKLKIYLDPSVISHLEQNDVPDKMEQTRKVWETLKMGKYEVIISDLVLAEINECKEPKRSILNVDTINGVRRITFAKRYNNIDIYAPYVLLTEKD